MLRARMPHFETRRSPETTSGNRITVVSSTLQSEVDVLREEINCVTEELMALKVEIDDFINTMSADFIRHNTATYN